MLSSIHVSASRFHDEYRRRRVIDPRLLDAPRHDRSRQSDIGSSIWVKIRLKLRARRLWLRSPLPPN